MSYRSTLSIQLCGRTTNSTFASTFWSHLWLTQYPSFFSTMVWWDSPQKSTVVQRTQMMPMSIWPTTLWIRKMRILTTMCTSFASRTSSLALWLKSLTSQASHLHVAVPNQSGQKLRQSSLRPSWPSNHNSSIFTDHANKRSPIAVLNS